MTDAARSAGGASEATLQIGAVDDTPVVLTGLAEGLRRHLPHARVSPVATTVSEFVALEPTVSLVLLDIELNDGSDPADNVRRLVARGWPVLVFTQERLVRPVQRAFRAGALGILSKGEGLPVVAQAVQTAAAGEPFLSAGWAAAVAGDSDWVAPNLTPREVEAVRLYAAGMKLGTVARRLGVAEDTARTYLLRSRAKYSGTGRPAATKTDLYIRAVEDGILPPPQAPTTGAAADPPEPD